MHLLYRSNNFPKAPWCERVNDLHHSLFHLLNCLITWLIKSQIHSRTAMILSNPGVGIIGFHAFPKFISRKVNLIERLQFELAYCYVLVKHFSHSDIGTPLSGKTYIYIKQEKYSFRFVDYIVKCKYIVS